MSITIEDFNREILFRRDINYTPVCQYLEKNIRSDLFYRICENVCLVIEERKIGKTNDEGLSGEIYNEASLQELGRSINQLKTMVYHFDFDRFFIMMLYYFPLLIDDTEKRKEYQFRYPQRFKHELLQRLDLKDEDIKYEENNITKKHYNLSPLKRQLFSRLCALKDTFIFEIKEKTYVSIGWCEEKKHIKFAKLCDDDDVLRSFDDMMTIFVKINGLPDDDEKINFKLKYQNYKDHVYSFMNEKGHNTDELIDFMSQIDDNQAMRISKQLEAYRIIHQYFIW